MKKIKVRNKKKNEVKQSAFTTEKENEGQRSIINWIFGGLVLLGILFAAYSVAVFG